MPVSERFAEEKTSALGTLEARSAGAQWFSLAAIPNGPHPENQRLIFQDLTPSLLLENLTQLNASCNEVVQRSRHVYA